MAELILEAFMAQLMSSSCITAQNVLELRKNVFDDGVMTRGEAQMLLNLDRTCADKCPEWTPFLNEAIADYIVNQERPSGYISQDNAVWLQNTLAVDNSETAIGVLVHVLDRAKSAPDSLSAFGLSVVARHVLSNDAKEPVITKADVSTLRKVLYAFSGAAGTGMTKAEVEVLFDLNDQTAETRNDPEWNDLFAKAVASYILCASGHKAPAREDALRQEKFLDGNGVNVGGFVGRMMSGGLTGLADVLRGGRSLEQAHAEHNAEFDSAQATAEIIDETEAKWVAERIGRDGKLHDNERSLLIFLKHEARAIHPALRPLLDKVA